MTDLDFLVTEPLEPEFEAHWEQIARSVLLDPTSQAPHVLAFVAGVKEGARRMERERRSRITTHGPRARLMADDDR